MSEPCVSCQLIQCENPPDVAYNLQSLVPQELIVPPTSILVLNDEQCVDCE